MQTVLREMLTRERSPRVPEPDLVMDNPENVAAYVEAGREHAVMAPVYLFHGANICEVIKPGDTVVDLACGPANQLGLVARLNPDINFIGVDMSPPMLERARELVERQGLKNVTFREGDITNLSMFGDASIDAVMSTMALHHLPTTQMLGQTYAEVARILKPGGGVYMADFGHLKARRSIEYFGYQYADRQPELFTIDYVNSLHAAFYPGDFEAAVRPLAGRANLHKTFGLPFMLALKSPVRRGDDPALVAKLAEMKRNLPEWHKQDLADLIRHFRMGGMVCEALGAAP
ncbi:methyltransferase domain-containing protein [Pseudoduganella sp. RAF53_2]|uniref:class I SAM-dependent methyltransferase n=1 Tax=unclassified Pseudoduganella TaxID=2637179 RepID=UPI003F990CE9